MGEVFLTAKDAPVLKILSSEYTLVIPEYQRPYDWTVDEAETLLDDLLSHMERSSGAFKQKVDISDIPPYFLGSLVLAREEKSKESDVVDGQQRLTTITLLLACIRERLKSVNEEAANDINDMIFEKGNKIYNIKEHYRLTLRKRDKDFFRKNIQAPGGLTHLLGSSQKLTEPQALLVGNASMYFRRLGALADEHVERLATMIATKCYMVVVETKDVGAAYRVFSVLNDRGRDLSDTDILKAELLGDIQEDRGHYADIWVDIEERLGRKEFGNLLGHIKAIETKITKQGGLVEEFRERVVGRKSKPFIPAKFIEEELLPLASIYRDLLSCEYRAPKSSGADRDFEDKVNECLYWLMATPSEDWVPLALLVWQKIQSKPDEMARFFVGLERLSYSMLIRNVSASRRVMRFAEVIREAESPAADMNKVMGKLDLTPAECRKTVHALNGPIYESVGPRKLRVLLQRISSLMSSDKMVASPGSGSRAVSIEHIYPQNPKEGSQWTVWIKDPKDREEWVNCLGNLTLLNQGKNSGAGRKELEEKKIKYFKEGGITPFAITAGLAHFREWGVPQIRQRQNYLIDLLSEYWKLDVDEARDVISSDKKTKRVRRRPFCFDDADIGVGSELVWKRDASIKVEVVPGNMVSHNGQEMSLSEITKRLLGNDVKAVRPVCHWLYNGKGLDVIYKEYASY